VATHTVRKIPCGKVDRQERFAQETSMRGHMDGSDRIDLIYGSKLLESEGGAI